MSDGAGPSACPSTAELQLADVKFQEGVACIKSNDIERAVQLFGQVLQTRSKHYGELAPECASAYYRYGSALLYQAQDSADVFGGPINAAAEADDDKENLEAEDAAGEAPPADGGAGLSDKGKSVAAEPVAEEGGEDAEDGDLQLAWENLETARAIWAKNPEANRAELAGVYVLLGDVGMEKEEFSVALSDYDSALEHYRLSGADEDDRRLADIHFQRARCLELMDRLDEALAAVQDAIAVLERKKAVLKAEGGKDAEQQAVEVDAVLKGLKEKVEDLGEAISEAEATRAAMRGAMEQLGAAMAAAAGGANRTGASGSSGNPASSSPIKDLGVVGRGTKRINLAPTLAPAGDAAVQGDGSAGAQTAKKKRSLDDLMGPSAQGTTTVGFGAQDKDMQPQADNKSAPSFAVPAFLKALADKTQQKDV